MNFKTFSQLIMIEQTLFALPFAYLGVLFAGGGTWTTWVWVTVAMVAGRTAGMSFNRVIDAEIDGKNPRTEDRLVPRGDVLPASVWGVGIVAAIVLIGASYMLNNLCFYLSFLAVGMLVTYSYFKRFSSSSHFYLGLVEAAAPIGGYLAVTAKFAVIPFILGFVITMWIAGLDIFYALQDVNFDRKEGLYSVPARFGKKNALAISSCCYVLAIGAMIVAGIIGGMRWPYWISVLFVSMIFFYQQRLARSEKTAIAIPKLFHVNLYVSPVLLAGTAVTVFF